MNNANSRTLQSYSIKTRLTLFYGLTTVVLLVITALFFYLITMHILHQANRQFMLDEISILRKLLENQPKKFLGLEQEVIEIPYTETGSEYRYYIRILDKNKNTILQTPRFNYVLTAKDFWETASHEKEEEIIHRNIAANKFLLIQTQGKLNNSNEPVFIQIALDITYQQNIIYHYSHLLIITLFSIILLAILMGYFIANRAMRSLYRLTDATKQITVTSLHQRIDPKSWPRELNSLGRAFNAMLGRIENAVLHLTQFSGDLAHELRTPINNLMGEAEIILSRPHSMKEYQEVLESHLEELQRVSHIIENILFLARTENPMLEIKKEEVHVENEITMICEFYQAMADEKNIRIESEGDAVLQVNLIMFRRALSNVLSNALKYTPENGLVRFKVKESENTVEIIVEDNGIGIAEEHLPKLFNRFYRVDSARARAAGGIGLGLPIVKSIVELHHGSILVKSELNKRTEITLSFPRV
ncbi:MAG TPA: heavy metal sensor histidine kinase [Gammaproteobacteria bacterium]|nr:heavy metal sensor histidine kinase [Gammaproteobacteria bacterium]